VVRPLLDEAFPGLRHSAARLGEGSEVLGFDTKRSTDHDWGPRLQIFLAGDTYNPVEPAAFLTRLQTLGFGQITSTVDHALTFVAHKPAGDAFDAP
jgi:hypothetical protein